MVTRPDTPVQAVMGVPTLDKTQARRLAHEAVDRARQAAPRSSGVGARGMDPEWGEGWFGISWSHDHIWFQEAGINPFTMNNLAGKTIPMWVNDLNGDEARKNPKARTRTTDDGRAQVLIFRRAARHGQRKDVWRQAGGEMVKVNVPMSYPGAPGRIAVNRSQGVLRAGSVIGATRNRGQIAPRNVGVRWRHPGLEPGRFMARGIQLTAIRHGYPVEDVVYLTRVETRARNYNVIVGK